MSGMELPKHLSSSIKETEKNEENVAIQEQEVIE